MPRSSVTRITTGLLLSLALAPLVDASDPVANPGVLPPVDLGVLYVPDSTDDAIYAIEDLNDDGDADDAGEIRIFYDDTTASGLMLATPRFVAVDESGVVFIGDSNTDQILRIEDLNDDGDGNDAGESSVYLDATSLSLGLTSINNLAFDDQGFLYFSDTGTSSGARYIARCRDDNSDGFCSEAAGEVFVIRNAAVAADPLIERMNGMFIDPNGDLYASEFFGTDEIFRLCDSNMDGDAEDAGETVSIFQGVAGGAIIDFTDYLAYRPSPVLSFFANAGPTEDTILLMEDLDASGSILNPGETFFFLDSSQADGLTISNARGIAVDATGALFVAEAGSSGVPEKILRCVDLNGDLDANDSGEVSIFADLLINASGFDLTNPQNIAFERIPVVVPVDEFTRGDCNDSGAAGLADVIAFLGFLFQGGTVACQDSCDANDDGQLALADVIAILNFLFVANSPPLAPPGSFCGPDVNPDMFPDCTNFTSCP